MVVCCLRDDVVVWLLMSLRDACCLCLLFVVCLLFIIGVVGCSLLPAVSYRAWLSLCFVVNWCCLLSGVWFVVGVVWCCSLFFVVGVCCVSLLLVFVGCCLLVVVCWLLLCVDACCVLRVVR